MLHDQTHRGGTVIANMSVSERLQKAFTILSTDEFYQEEYQKFVQSMSYADAKYQLSYDDALLALEELLHLVDK